MMPRRRSNRTENKSSKHLAVATTPGAPERMVRPGLKLRYILAVLLVGAVLTAAVATTVHLSEQAERQELSAIERTFAALAPLDPGVGAAHAQLRQFIARGYDERVVVIATAGTLLTLAAGLVIFLLMLRIDRALIALMDNARSIGRGRYAEPVTVSGVAEVAALERSLEQMRQALTTTAISRDYLDDVLNGIRDAVLVTTPGGTVQTANAAAGELFGLPEQDLAGVTLRDLIAPEHLAAFNLAALKDEPGETVIRSQSGQTIPVSIHVSPLSGQAGSNRGKILVLHDVTDRKRAERRIRYLARFDTLTKMPNRLQFQHLLHQAITRNLRAGRGLVLLYVDIDNFKEINDTFGHETGDRVLETISERLARVLPHESVAGRLAGDEFAIFAESPEGGQARQDQGRDLARLVLAEIAKPLHLPGQEIDVTASIGVATVPEHADNVIDLIRNADAAMYHAKRQGRNCHVHYVPEMNAAAVERLMLKAKLRRALERDEFVLRYQPKVDLASGEVVGSEALLRWRLPGHGEIAPSQFIPLAEESRLILDIGAWVLNQVCIDYSAWQQSVNDPGASPSTCH
jgi:diguanylate cyclase (GGDEF)-like protein/PAS domain S-box-containing protein